MRRKLDRCELIPPPRIPDFDDTRFSEGRQFRPINAPSYAEGRSFQLEGKYQAARLRVPQEHVAIKAGGGESGAVGRVCQISHGERMPAKRLQELAGGGVEHLDRRVVAGDRDASGIRRPLNRPDRQWHGVEL